ncbi:MAG: hypothetical protein A3A87_01720 [Candidatus Muproteobacteria bacterium RIFCSPLOWO2_01_FULL_60_18]|uniref:Streptomycin biosynthesis protein StrF domain-containing protein n=1 Tax=Candidatus Muproteobacteria bacterium RIFCSPLOWO2_01_FULL_60_18 TaxID=1817768 RepID=A0A1F6TWS3_9PROT|nr:MAG: hypothetical protein A3A87_01720 [Candidatus Muproteobacteria bacterium RIFCSPLOWO2_01_FULL_60_18]
MISIIICSIDDSKFKAVTDNYSKLLAGEEFEIIGIHDAKSLCEGYNRGIRLSCGSILVFSHDDIEILSPDFKYKLMRYLAKYDIIGVAGTTHLIGGNWIGAGRSEVHGQVAHWIPQTGEYAIAVYGNSAPVIENIQALDGLFFAVNRHVTQKVLFDEMTFDGFHHYDLDFTFAAYLANFRLAVCNDIAIVHQSTGKHDAKWEEYRRRFLAKHEPALMRNRSLKPVHDTVVVKTKEEVLSFWSE